MKTLLGTSTRKPRKSRQFPPTPNEPVATTTSSAAPRVTGEEKEQKKSPLPDTSPETEFKRVLDSSDLTGVQRNRQIAELAYNLFLQRGKELGHALEDWLEAENRLQAHITAETLGGIE